jgi:Fe-S-cluster formation regulator IscX/YfhJ
MIIDAIDLLYSSWYDGFCLILSDSDFTQLAARIRESGLTVYRFREHKTPRPFVTACNKFIYTKNLMHIDELVPHSDSVNAGENHSLALQTQNDSDLACLLRMTVEAVSNDDGWARLSNVSQLLTKRYPDFDPRTYGYHKLSNIITNLPFFETARRSLGKGSYTEIFVHDKRRKPKDLC